MADIFISYKSERRPAARHLKKVLDCYFKDSGNECVWYDYGLIPGDDFEPRIMAEIEKAKVVLVLWCEMAVKSPWVLKEASEARRTSKFLPARIETCALPDDFAGADTINISDWDASPRNSLLDRLLDDVGRRIGREPVSRISSLRELEEDWRGYGAPSLAMFALGQALTPRSSTSPAPAHGSLMLGTPPIVPTPNLSRIWTNAGSGDAEALTQLARHYALGEGGLSKNEHEAARLYKFAAERGHPRAQMMLGIMYANGSGGLPQDKRESVRLYGLAAEQGYGHAQMLLGVMYETGTGELTVDFNVAFHLYKQAAEQGVPTAQLNLGRLYERGLGVQKDENQAIRFYTLAARQGHQTAQENLTRLGKTW